MGNGVSIEVRVGDITALEVDAIVNAANPQLERGGGVCGAIHRAAGPQLAAQCRLLGGCPTGAARITPGFQLPAKWVIHAVGPVWRGGAENEDELLRSCYREALALAVSHGIRSLGFPAISTGIYGFPLERATRIVVGTVRGEMRCSGVIDRVVFMCFDAGTAEVYTRVLGEAE
jgi:O-acetyl-ADP-ribose deacetylase (regulator of RNase III)